MWQSAFSFFESVALRSIRRRRRDSADRRTSEGELSDEPGRGRHRGRVGHGPGRLPAPRRARATASRVLDLDGDAAEAAAERHPSRGEAPRWPPRSTSVDRAAVDEALAQVRAELGPVEIMVTSAGLDMFETFTDISAESWDRVIAVNLTGTFHCLQAAVPDMLAGGWGRIVTISSSSAQSGAARMAHYVASKGGVIGLTKALAVEYAAEGHHREHDPAGGDRHADGAPRRSRRRPPEHRRDRGPHAGTPGGDTRRHRGGLRVLVLRRRGLHHRSDHRCQRRLGTCDGTPRLAPLPVEQWGDDERAALRSGVPDEVAPRFLSTGPDALPASERASAR